MEPKYLGDGIYFSVENHGTVVLTTGNHNTNLASNIIYLEPQQVINLMNALNELAETLKHQKP